jgi:SAM-dependent methyltransferase
MLTRDEILAGFDALSDIYAHVPPLIMWRAWEYAAYRRYALSEPVLDVGCGDGRFFRRCFPTVHDVVGVDLDEAVVDLARQSGLYSAVHLAPADAIPVDTGAFGSAFANCSLEHMDRLDAVLAEVHRTLRPGGTFLASVVTDRFITWQPLAGLLTACGAPALGADTQQAHEAYHHLVNPFPRAEWVAKLERAGFTVEDCRPIVEGPAGWTFLLLDQLWHVRVRAGQAELGDDFASTLQGLPNHAAGVRKMFDGLLEMSAGAGDHAGLVWWARKAS